MLKKILPIFYLLLFFSLPLMADDTSLHRLKDLKASKLILLEEINAKKIEMKSKINEETKKQLEVEIKELTTQADELNKKFEKIATGIDTSVIQKEDKNSKTTLSEDLQFLLEPLIESARDSTQEIRKKAKIQEEISYYKETLPKVTQAYQNIVDILEKSDNKELDKELKKDLEKLKKYWGEQVQLFSNNLNVSLHEIEVVEKNAVTFGSSLRENTKNFFNERGLFLFEGIMAFIMVLLIMKLIYALAVKLFPVFSKPSRSFYLRLVDLIFRLLTIILAIVIPMAVFYLEEDWFLFSLALLIFIGMLWTFRNLIAKLWQQARLFLNVGAVREEERIMYEGLPWKVKSINVFTMLENPTTKVKLRIPIEKLVDLTSRPFHPKEPWFPCKINDWMMLSDGYYGKVIGISLELIKLEAKGGGHKTYLVTDFLALTPLNLSVDFRLVEKFGISYKHQKESTTIIVEQLEAFILTKIEEENHSDGFKGLLVQFGSAEDSALSLTIVADLTGEMAILYYPLKRSLHRWCVDACNEYGWEIPFPQLTIHQPTP